MKTKIMKLDKISSNEEIFKEAGRRLREGGLVAFPTETVYGLGADGLDEDAVRKIFLAKGRPQDNPLILHIDSLDMLEELTVDISEEAMKLMDRFWPGPLTIIFKRSRRVPDVITAGLETVAIRMPDHKVARAIIRESGRAIAAPSANTSGRPSPTTAQHVYEDLDGKIDMIVDGGSTGIGLESTVIDLSESRPMILRPGGVTLEDLKEVLPDIGEDRSLIDDSKDIIPKSPGQKYRHYAPNKDMVLFIGSNNFMVESIVARTEELLNQGKKVGIIATDENIASYQGTKIKSLGSQADKEAIGHNLFNIYRSFNEEDVDIILSESVEEQGFGKAIMNRMKKACGGNIVRE